MSPKEFQTQLGIEEYGDFMYWLGREGWEKYDGWDRYVNSQRVVIGIAELYEDFKETKSE